MPYGILLYLRQEGRGIGLTNKIRAYALQDHGLDTVEANIALGFRDDERDYSVAAHMLDSLGVQSVRLMTNNPRKIDGLRELGVDVVDRIPLVMQPNRVQPALPRDEGARVGPPDRRPGPRAGRSRRSSASPRPPPGRPTRRPRPMSADPPVVLVTGATGPLGRAAVKRFAADGARLALVGPNRGPAGRVAAEAGARGRRLAAGRRRPPRPRGRVAPWSTPSRQRFGRLDVLLHLVGGWAGGTPVVDLDADEIRSMLDQHLWTTFHLVQAVVPGHGRARLRAAAGGHLAVRRQSRSQGGGLRDRQGRRGAAAPVAGPRDRRQRASRRTSWSSGRSTRSTSARRRRRRRTPPGRRPRRSRTRSRSSPRRRRPR